MFKLENKNAINQVSIHFSKENGKKYLYNSEITVCIIF